MTIKDDIQYGWPRPTKIDPQIESIALSLLSELRSDGLGGKLY